MLITRLAKILFSLCLGLFCLLVAYDNVIDYGANFAFVGHVLAMDTVFPNNPLRSRAITDPALWRAAYAIIIAVEALSGVLFLVGALQMLRAVRAEAAIFQRAKAGAIAGGALAVLLWFFGFMVIAGEWFAMWQSAHWNAQASAFRFYATMLLLLIFLSMRDEDRSGA